MNCHLLVPNLFWPESVGVEPYRELALPALETLLARGTRRKHAGISLERWLADAFRIAPQYDLPLAALALRGDGGEPGTGCWLQADPVHLKIHGDRPVLADASRFEITRQEADELLAALNAHFAQDGLAFVAPAPQRWYARAHSEPRIRTTPTGEVAGRSVEHFLPAGDDSARWHSIMNEAQMLLHQHPCNEAREARGELPINSVWFWGAGRLPEVARDAPYGTVWSDHPLAAGLAAATSVQCRALPESGERLTEVAGDAAQDRPQLIIADRLRRAACGDVQGWRAALVELEQRWFAPLLDALKRGAAVSVTLHALGPEYSLTSLSTRRDCFKFWRVARPLAAYAA